MKIKKLLSVVLMLCVLISTCIVGVTAAEVEYVGTGAQVEIAETGKDYGLMDDIQDGNILHCFCWKHTDIIAMLPQIAEAGFTSVQVSPPQSTAGTGSWWWFYQPQGFYIGSNAMGNKQTLTQLCTEAEKYGIKIIVDIVANHLAGDHNNIQNDLKDGQYWHSYGGGANDGDRNSVINGTIGMPDLNTGHPYVQQCVRNYVMELKSIGVDGIRWDAAKHIGLPSEGDGFWPAVTNNTGLYHYGEILNNPGVDRNSEHGKALLREYCQYMSITDSTYGMDLRNAFNSGQAPSHNGVLTSLGMSASKMVYWGESHDTWSNNQDWGYSNGMNQNVIDRAYAVAGSRAEANALYFSRPSTANKDSIQIGAKGSTHFTSPEVAAVNHFRNAMNGQKEYVTSGSNCTIVCREQGAVVVAGSGSNFSVSVPNGGGTVKPGTYTDEITGATWTVTSSTISGHIGSSGIAVIYNPTTEPSVSVSQKGGNFKTDTLSLTLELNNATSGTYSVDGGSAQTFTGTKTITIGSGVSVGSTITVKLTATDGQTTVTETYTFTKVDPSASGVYFDNSSQGWGNVFCYIYNDDGAPAVWPGEKMTNEGNNVWFMDIPAGYEKCYVIFNDGGSNQTPGAQQTGFVYNGSPMIYRNGNWEPCTPTLKPTVPATSVSTPVVTEPSTPSEKVLLGDIDDNTIVNIKDATKVQVIVASAAALNARETTAADCDSNGVINIKDAALIQKYIAGVTTIHPIGKYVDCNGSVVTTPTTPVATTPVVTTPTVTEPAADGKNAVYFVNSSGWSVVYAYVWGDEGDLAKWPGTQMTHVSGTVYKIDVDKKYNKIIFCTSNGTNKTEDLTIPGNNSIYSYSAGTWNEYSGNADEYGTGGNNNNNNSGNTVTIKFIDSGYWGYAKAVCWSNSNSQQRTEYEMRSIGNNMFEAQIPSGYDKIYFTNGHQWCQDQNFPAGGGTFDYYTGWK